MCQDPTKSKSDRFSEHIKLKETAMAIIICKCGNVSFFGYQQISGTTEKKLNFDRSRD